MFFQMWSANSKQSLGKSKNPRHLLKLRKNNKSLQKKEILLQKSQTTWGNFRCKKKEVFELYIQRIVITTIRKPRANSLNDELQWFGNSLGLFGERDKNKSCFRMFIELVKAVKQEQGLTSDELAQKVGLTRATVVHHLNTLMERGIIIHRQNEYIIRGDRLSALVEDIQRDVKRQLIEVKKAAEELDRLLEL